MNREVCEGKCAMGRTCPTGLCRQSSKRNISSAAALRRKSSNASSQSSGGISQGRTPPATPRLLPSAPPSPANNHQHHQVPRSASAVVTCRSSYSGPSGLHYYTGSAPTSRYKTI